MSVDYLVLETLSEQWKWQWWYCLSAKEIIGESILVYPLIWSDVQECTGLNEYKWWKLLLPLFTVFKTNGPFQNSPKEWNWLRWDGYLRVVWAPYAYGATKSCTNRNCVEITVTELDVTHISHWMQFPIAPSAHPSHSLITTWHPPTPTWPAPWPDSPSSSALFQQKQLKPLR